MIGILSLGLLLFGSVFASAALATTVFLVVFWFVFGIADNSSYDPTLPASFSMCVLPFVLSIMSGILVALLCMCLIQKVVWMSFFIMGVCIGGICMYVLRDIIITANPSLATDPAFMWYWLATALVAIGCGGLAAWLKELVFVISSVAVGAFGMATFICGLIPVVGGEPVGGAAFVAIMIASGAIGGLFQYMYNKNKADSKKPSYDNAKDAPYMRQ